jgi:hypothetical protein
VRVAVRHGFTSTAVNDLVSVPLAGYSVRNTERVIGYVPDLVISDDYRVMTRVVWSIVKKG